MDINVDSWPYLVFFGKNPGKCTRYFMFQVLPFSLSTACYVFTKLRFLVEYWRSKGKRIVIYIVDGICASSTLQKGYLMCPSLNLAHTKLATGKGL